VVSYEKEREREKRKDIGHLAANEGADKEVDSQWWKQPQS